jgi:DNA repair protein RadC
MKAYQRILKVEKGTENFESVKVTTSKGAEEYARKFYFDDLEIYESMFLMLLNRSNMIIGWVKISQGGIASTVCDIKIMLKYAIETLASGIILVHNHPAGTPSPSQQDILLTEKVCESAKLLDITLIDHVILAKEKYYSFADEGRINF